MWAWQPNTWYLIPKSICPQRIESIQTIHRPSIPRSASEPPQRLLLSLHIGFSFPRWVYEELESILNLSFQETVHTQAHWNWHSTCSSYSSLCSWSFYFRALLLSEWSKSDLWTALFAPKEQTESIQKCMKVNQIIDIWMNDNVLYWILPAKFSLL